MLLVPGDTAADVLEDALQHTDDLTMYCSQGAWIMTNKTIESIVYPFIYVSGCLVCANSFCGGKVPKENNQVCS